MVIGLWAAEATTPASRRKQANWQKKKFDATISKMLGKKVLQFHESEFTADVLFPLSGRFEWLARRRPKLAMLLSEITLEIHDDEIIESLLKFVHEAEALQGARRTEYKRFNTAVSQSPELIWRDADARGSLVSCAGRDS